MDQNPNMWAAMAAQAESQTAIQPIVTRRGNYQRSEGTGVLHINMNSHDNQGTIIGIPLYDLAAPIPHLFFYDQPLQADAYFKTQQGEMASRTRTLLSAQAYDLSDPDKKARYDQLRNDFESMYKNKDMLTKTDWISSVRNPLYFGFYMWVISHVDANNKQICDKSENKIPHRGASGEGRLAFVQFKGFTAFQAWEAMFKGYESLGQTRAMVYPRLFGRDGFRASALMITYSQDQSKQQKPFVASFVEKSFADPAGLAAMVNDRGANPNAYHILPEWIEAAKNINAEFLNTDAEVLFDDAHVYDFSRAVKGILNCFDFYQACGAETSDEGKAKYDAYVESCGFNESSQANAAKDAASAAQAAPQAMAPGAVPQAPAGNATIPGVAAPSAAPGVVPGAIPQMPGAVPAMPGQVPGAPAVGGAPVIPSAPSNFDPSQAPAIPGGSPQGGVVPGAGFPGANPSWGAGGQQ